MADLGSNRRDAFVALVCGYGVPKDIFQDKNYHGYLVPCLNYLFDRYSDLHGTIVLDGGATDVMKPYKRTEAGEMAKWWRKRIHELNLSWRLVVKPKSLSSVENILNFKNSAVVDPVGQNTEMIIFCEATRAKRLRLLAKEIFVKQRFTLVPIDFDGSTRRYQPLRTKEMEQEFLRFEIAAIHDPAVLKQLRALMKEKLRLMRTYKTSEEAHRKLPDILEQLHERYAQALKAK